MAARAGRSRKTGPRHPGGRLIAPPDEGRAQTPAWWRRIMEHARFCGLDPALGYEVGRLRAFNEITETQLIAADLIGRTYAHYEAVKGLRRSARSPSYDGARGGGDVDPDYAATARERFMRLAQHLMIFAPITRNALEALCCEGRPIGYQLREVCVVLDVVADIYGLKPSAGQSDAGEKEKPPTIRAWRAPAQPEPI